jgi:hypothetical protein
MTELCQHLSAVLRAFSTEWGAKRRKSLSAENSVQNLKSYLLFQIHRDQFKATPSKNSNNQAKMMPSNYISNQL